jgi:hypothetical protein
VHKSPERARPGPNVDDDVEIIAFFDHHLRGGPALWGTAAQVYVREPVAAQPDLAFHPGRWVDVPAWPSPRARMFVLRSEATAVERHVVVGDIGVAAWNSCGGALPWGQPLDQRVDNARSVCFDWPIEQLADVLGHAEVRMRVASDRPYGHVSVKLCDVAPDGASTLISRGMLDLRHRGCWPADETGEVDRPPADLTPGEWIDVDVPVEATTWRLTPGHKLRLAVAGSDWPNCWPPPGPVTLSIDSASIAVELPVVDDLPDSTHPFVAGAGPSDDDGEGVVWRFEHDVLARETRVATRYGGTYDGRHGATVTDDYRGELGVSTVDPGRAWARGASSYEVVWPEAHVRTEASLEVTSDGGRLRAEIRLVVWDGGEQVAERRWSTSRGY